MKTRKLLLEQLITVRDHVNGVKHPKLRKKYGICRMLYILMLEVGETENDKLHHLRNELFNDWPERSGSTAYPVPHKSLAPMNAFADKKWTRKTEYGRARRRLLDFMIESLMKK